MESKTRVLIADANEDFRQLMTEVINGEGDMEVVGSAGSGTEAL